MPLDYVFRDTQHCPLLVARTVPHIDSLSGRCDAFRGTELADPIEEQLRTDQAERQIAELIDDDEILAQQGFDNAPALAGDLPCCN